MFICGSNFVGGSNACAVTPTDIQMINYIELQYGMYDDLYLTQDVEFEISSTIPQEWDFNTVLYAKFNTNTNAGNVDWSLNNISDLAIKKRESTEFEWVTIKTKEINTLDDLIINFDDHMVASGSTYEYAVVPVLYGSEGVYSSTNSSVTFSKMFIVEHDTIYSTAITDGYCDTTRNIPSTNVELLNSRYPIFVRNSIANYDTGQCTGMFMPEENNEECTDINFNKDGDYIRTSYQKGFMDFICDGVPKILKLPDGRMWLIQVTPNPTDSAKDAYNMRDISFSWVEIGSVHSEADLYYLGFSDVEEQWWNK